ncbi:methyltransferase type 12 [Asanoa ishikariensis]|uniref:Thiopurine S-methyltransferase (TPMT) n=1 Tax=Asanoa ishikariensis TaxID=137265 RepID=A0A1H3TQW0_9ACTN|nr:class I SAM-dependent methyltransferase [Asanoa ishikariensis]GIF62006.1 methyltransferase type 12 [Asanoa ishikariensis]SDZ52288.1 Thiopurine S-methyltransferase (TPMT) [Asanoa ishikariensis]
MDPDAYARELASEAIAEGDPTGWFERLYAAAADGAVAVPWDRATPHSLLAEWAARSAVVGDGRRALVVGAGLGRDAEFVAGLGFDVVAFDISATAIASAKQRHPDSSVRYVVADLFDPPGEWRGAFDLVVESMTVQALPEPPRRAAIAQVGPLVAPGGTLLVIAAGRDPQTDFGGPPWPLTRDEIDAFAVDGLTVDRVEELREPDAPIFRWRVELHR